MTMDQILAEIYNLLSVYHQQGLLDEIAIRNGIKENLQEFGGNLMQSQQVSLRVEKGRVKLPDNFWALTAAVKCEQEGYIEATTEKQAQNRISYLEWTNINDYYNYLDGKPCKEDGDSKYITETLYFEVPKKSYTFYYKQPQQLRLIPHVYKVKCDSDCPNLTANSPYEISIDENHNYLTTNFNDGFIWLWYKGLPCDEKGDLLIPRTSKDKLKNYILYFAVVRALERLWLTEDDVNIANKLQYFKRLSDEYFYAAKSESVNKGLKNWATKITNANRINTLKYENMFGRL